jgi:hypothetical protein
MATNKANFGIGDAAGYFGYGVAGTAATVDDAILISADGITATFPEHEVLKDWSNTVIRSMPGEDLPTVQANFITTSADLFTILFEGTTIDPNKTPTVRSFIFQMVDGDDTITYSTLNGVVTAVDDVTFAPNEIITWNATITADSWTISKTSES